ncbi:hypothetical protein [Sporichthya polymorpha]|uniref:hypothetical protein n=1 Tax=Sporichthya polymorpha TaxID=35751 RepID=UPI0003A9FE87|nr:hypothetical protein [Sporichthya polymorpha]
MFPTHHAHRRLWPGSPRRLSRFRPSHGRHSLAAAVALSLVGAALASPVIADEPHADAVDAAALASPLGPAGPAPAPGDRFLPRGWERTATPAPSAATPGVTSEPVTADVRASRAAARPELALRRPEVVIGQPLPQRVLAKPIQRRARLPHLSRACGYTRRIQQLPALDAHQLANARTIVAVGQLLGLPPRAAVIALATAYQESWIRNLNWGDRDSLGLFQQRPSYGWGTRKQITTPAYAAAAFYGPLVSIPGWERMPLTVAAQAVQRSAFPNRYAQWELLAATVVDRLLEVPDRELRCRR